MNRRIVERITNWAKGVTQFNREASHLERKYDISESDILRSINHLPPQVAIITVRVPGKKPHLPLTESEQQGADPTPEAQS
jgi:hypothetical protein